MSEWVGGCWKFCSLSAEKPTALCVISGDRTRRWGPCIWCWWRHHLHRAVQMPPESPEWGLQCSLSSAGCSLSHPQCSLCTNGRHNVRSCRITHYSMCDSALIVRYDIMHSDDYIMLARFGKQYAFDVYIHCRATIIVSTPNVTLDLSQGPTIISTFISFHKFTPLVTFSIIMVSHRSH